MDEDLMREGDTGEAILPVPHADLRAEVAEKDARIERIIDQWRETNRECIKHWNRADKAEAALARVKALADELDALAEPHLTGSLFFDSPPATRTRLRAMMRRDIAAAIRGALAEVADV